MDDSLGILRRLNGKGCVVTGGASFIGSTLVDRLLEIGSRVLVVDDFSSGKRLNLDTRSVEVLELDLYESESEFEERISDFKTDVVFHLAAIHGGRGFIETYPEAMLKNLVIDNRVFETSVRAGVKRLVHASSACAYPINLQSGEEFRNLLNESEAGFSEPGKAYPDGVYGWSKLMGEYQLATVCLKSSMTGRSARIFTAYGERENESHAAIALIAKSLMHLDPFPVWGNGKQTRNFTYVEDTVNGLLLLAADERNLDFDVFNIGSDSHIKVLDFIEEIFRQVNWRPNKFDFQLDKPVGVASRAADNRKIRETFGWCPSTSIEIGIQKTVAWYEALPNRPKTAGDLESLLLARG